MLAQQVTGIFPHFEQKKIDAKWAFIKVGELNK
jgi:hypothetical protein